MSTEVLLSLFLPIFFGAAIICLTIRNTPAYAATTSASARALKLMLLAAPVFVYGFYLVALRPLDAGNDTFRYVLTYSNLNGPTSAIAIGTLYYGNTEFLWWPLQSILATFLNASNWLIANFVLVFVATWLFYRSAARSLGLSSAIFALVFLTFFLVYSGNIMRQALAAPLGALGFFLFFQRRRISASLLIAVAIGLHWSSVAFLAAPLFNLRVLDRDRAYLIVALSALIFSTLASKIIGDLVATIGISSLTDKFNLYFSGTHESHVGAVWKTANFWICTLLSATFLSFINPRSLSNSFLHKYTCLFLSLILFGVNTADFAERYMPFLLLAAPLQAALLVDRLRAPSPLKSAMYLYSFIVLSALVLLAESSQHTLGYTL
ncbi:EpsG family protein [Stenotrophomonas maltophilia]|uniref:EpsG family protein n=1 Tax=Stenotrophomonas maltophilia TaxID=40324 RepID=A0A6B8J2F7_STEMA|nr:EpsG family protein [Stenotrophomonas maltophilia]MBH1651846.1 EpsG family protein [Stenotrophomonas maltophilia]QGM00993.1 EpsG family protein [Stenotrophomonas maltophilia]HDS1509732.1 EpsG family protein [Stenotrophomonas maltophilia]